jgi:hypothetical protein
MIKTKKLTEEERLKAVDNFKMFSKIAERADRMGLLFFDRQSLIMDLEYVHTEFNLRLEELLNADDGNFSHDINGIQHNFNRQTKKMDNLFTPRYSAVSE